jgi:thioesterase domain-containing protein/aryl carrier-like protein
MNAPIAMSALDSALVDLLTPIWERVLARSAIRLDDNFFDLGGDSVLALALLIEVQKRTGRKLPIRAFYDAPTIAAMSALLQEGPRPEFSPLMLVRTGNQAPALFIAAYDTIANRIQSRHPIYSLRRGNEDTSSSVAELAQSYLSAIDRVESGGPYLLAGYCFDGLIMFEIAHRLLERGDAVARLVLVDTYPHRRYWALRAKLGSFAGRVKFRTLAGMKLPIAEIVPYFVGRCAAMIKHVRGRRKNYIEVNAATGLERNTLVPLGRDAYYEPRYYPGKLTLVQSEWQPEFLGSANVPKLLWGKLVQTLEVHRIACDHTQLFTTRAGELAKCLSSLFDVAPSNSG